VEIIYQQILLKLNKNNRKIENNKLLLDNKIINTKILQNTAINSYNFKIYFKIKKNFINKILN